MLLVEDDDAIRNKLREALMDDEHTAELIEEVGKKTN